VRTGECEFEAPTQADPVDRADGWDRQSLDGGEDLLAEPGLLLGVLGTLELADRVDVGAGHEGIGLTGPEDDRAYPAVGFSELGEVAVEPGHDGLVEHIHRPIRVGEGDPRDPVGIDGQERRGGVGGVVHVRAGGERRSSQIYEHPGRRRRPGCSCAGARTCQSNGRSSAFERSSMITVGSPPVTSTITFQ